MSVKLLLLLLPLAISGQLIKQQFNALRGIRQADQQAVPTQFIDPSLVINGYLPPPSDPQSASIFADQIQQTFDISPSSTFENEVAFSDSKPGLANNVQNQNVIANDKSDPSKFLSPPVNDFKARSSTTENVIFITTTKPTPQAFKQPERNQNVFAPVNVAQPTFNSRSYLPPQPEYSGAAQTPQAAVERPQQREPDHHHHHHDHHHHHHHHDENFDICTDAFHSFLCTPLKARRRITGAFPEHLRAQASFNQYRRVIPERVSNQYLPPVIQNLPNINLPPVKPELPRIIAPTNRIETTYLPPTTRGPQTAPTTTTTVRYVPPRVPQPSNAIDRSYLPPVKAEPPRIIAPSNRFETTYLPPTTRRPQTAPTTPTTTTTVRYVPPRVPQPSNTIDRSYLPPLPNNRNINSVHINTFNSFDTRQPSSTTSRPVVTTAAPTSRTFIQQQSTTVKSTTGKNFIQYTPSTLSFQQPQGSTFRATEKFDSTIVSSPSTTFQTSRTSVVPNVNFISPSAKPFTRTTNLVSLPSSTFSTTRNFQIDSSYLPPESTHAAASTPVTTLKPAVTPAKNSFSSTQKVIHRSSVLPEVKPSPSNVNVKIIENEENRNLVAPTVGYSYPKPEKNFPLPSEQTVLVPSTTPKPTTTTFKPTTTIRPTTINFKESESRVTAGYEYSKPTPEFPLPSEMNVEVIGTAQTAYLYPKPEAKLPLPSEQQVVAETVTTTVATTTTKPTTVAPKKPNGYQYEKPQVEFEVPKKKGYSYPKPDNPLQLPTETEFKPLFSESSTSSDLVKDLGSAVFIPVNKIDKRSKSSETLPRTRRFGERLTKLERRISL
ncbi:hypothetical protein RUM44_013215 [Polyplax serrata]|uniref:Uncharacterized protein n=1 Tax=Polyplax serrata TaxID=468196 RepID=A0ABR1BDI8_POLSC